MKKVWIMLFLALFIFNGHSVLAQMPEVTNGINYLLVNQNADGSWGNDVAQVDTTISTATVLEVLRNLGELGLPVYSAGRSWLVGQILHTNNHLVRRILADASTDADSGTILSSLDSLRKAWGDYKGYDIDILDTALALQALKHINHPDASVIGYGLNYLVSSINTDGGWGFTENSESNTYITALVIYTLQQYSKTYSFADAINKGVTFLKSHQNPDGGFGSSPSTVYETALSYLVLSGAITDNTILGNAVNYLNTNQGLNGSWSDDPFNTALALQALLIAGNRHTIPAQPDTGSVTGKILDANTNQPLSGVSVSLVGDSLANTTSDQFGNFGLGNVPAGIRAVTFSLPGYVVGSYDVNVNAGVIVNVGTIALFPTKTSGVIKGVVVDASTGLAISDAKLDVAGVLVGSFTTDTSGHYVVPGLPAGDIGITVSHSGYKPVSATTTMVAGKVLTFNPKLLPLSSTTTETVIGKVLDSVGAPIASATVSLLPDNTFAVASGIDGSFIFPNVSNGSRKFSISSPGFSEAQIFIDVREGQVNDIGDIALSVTPATGIIKGVVSDNNNAPLANAVVVVSGDFTASVNSGSDGSFIFGDVPLGNINITIEKTGYSIASTTGLIEAGSVLVFNPILVPSTGSLMGVILEVAIELPVEGVKISLASGEVASSGIDGVFLLENIIPGTKEITISASGFQTQTYQVLIAAGVTTDLQTVYLAKESLSSTITGFVTDMDTGSPVQGAEISIVGTDMSASADGSGKYLLSDVTFLDFTVQVSALGYDSQTYGFSAGSHGVYKANFELAQSQVSALSITNLSTQASIFNANENALIDVTIENGAVGNVDAILKAQVMNEVGEVVALVASADSSFSLGDFETVQKTLVWNTGQFVPGEYLITTKLIDPGTVSYDNTIGVVLAEKAITISITASPEIFGAISVSPPVTQVDMQRPVYIKSALRNAGNLPLTTNLLLQVKLNGNVVYVAENSVAGLAVNSAIELDFGSFVPQESGSYDITLTPADTSVVSNLTAQLFVGTHATTSFTVEPALVFPGNTKIKGRIHIEGVGILEGSTVDPKIPIIKDAIQKGVNYEQTAVMTWQNNNCNGCHIQSQALVGLEYSRDIVNVNPDISRNLFNTFTSWQAVDGSIRGYHFYFQTTTNLSLWGLISWHDHEEAKPYIVKAIDYLLQFQQANGRWVRDYYYGKGWWYDDVSYTSLVMMGLAEGYSLTGDLRYLESLTRATQWMATAGRVASGWNMVISHQIMGLNVALPHITDATLKSQITLTIEELVLRLQASQRSDGGWGRYSHYGSDSLVTAQVLYAILQGGLSGKDPGVESAIDFLLSNQAADGSWYSQNGILSTRLAATTWVVIALPIAFEKVMGIDVAVNVTSTENNTISKSVPFPARDNGKDVSWELVGIEETGQDIEFDLQLSGLVLGEERKVAEKATVTFRDDLTNEFVSIPIEIPSVKVVSPVKVGVTTDRPEFGSDETLLATVNIENISNTQRDVDLHVSVIDVAGNDVAVLGIQNISNLASLEFADWHYRIPMVVQGGEETFRQYFETTVDMSDVFTLLDIQTSTLDENSLRIVEIDRLTKEVIERNARITVMPDNQVKVMCYMDSGVTTSTRERTFYLYFDTLENGVKPPPTVKDMPETGKLIAYSNDDGYVYVSEASPKGIFNTPILVTNLTPSADHIRGVVLDDFNNDGFVDLVTGSGADNTIYFLQNKGDSTTNFTPKVAVGTITASGYMMDFASADFNNDGNKDFVTSGNNNILHLFLGNGDGTFEKSLIPPPPGGYLRAKLATDLNNDGIMDLLITEYYGGLYYYEGLGNALFATPVLFADIGLDPYGLVVGDYDNDGVNDIIVSDGCYRASCDTYMLKGNNDGTFVQPKKLFTLDPNNYAAYDTGDFDHDGNLDIIAATHTTRAVYYFKGTGIGSFEAKTLIGNTSASTLGISSSPALPEYTPVVGSPEVVTPTTFNFAWDTGLTSAGAYRVKAELLENNTLLDNAHAPFEIVVSSGTEPVLSTRVSTDKVAYDSGESVRINTLTQNQSTNYDYQNLDTQITITDSTGGNVFTETGRIMYLANGQFAESGTNWQTGQAPKGVYKVLHEVMAAGVVLCSVQTSFEVMGSSTTGAGISGSVTVSNLQVWQSQTFNFSLDNEGNEDLQNVVARILIIDPATDSLILTLEETLSVTRGAQTNSSLTADVSGFAPALYMAVLDVQTQSMTTPKTLGSVNFEVLPSLEAVIIATDSVNLLVWINDGCGDRHDDEDEHHDDSGEDHCKDRGDDDSDHEKYEKSSSRDDRKDGADDHDRDGEDDDDHGNKECASLDLINSVLTDVTDYYLIVRDRDDFERELRNPLFTDVMVLGDKHKLTDHHDDELKEMIYSGTGLIASLWLEHDLEEEVLGLEIEGRLSTDHGTGMVVETIDSPVSAIDTIAVSGRVNRLDDVLDDQVAGWISSDKCREKDDDHDGDDKGDRSHGKDEDDDHYRDKNGKCPAIVFNDYGQGGSVYMAFDLVSSLDLTTYDQFKDLLAKALSYVHKPVAQGGYDPYQVVPISTRLTSLGGAFDVRLTDTSSPELSLFDPGPGSWLLDNPRTTDIFIDADQTLGIKTFALMPDQPGDYFIETEVGFVFGTEYSFFDSLYHEFNVLGSSTELIDTILVELENSNLKKSRIRKAKKYLLKIQDRLIVDRHDIEKNIHDIEKVIDTLTDRDHDHVFDITEIRLMLGRLLSIEQGRWYFHVQ